MGDASSSLTPAVVGVDGVVLSGPLRPGYEAVLSKGAISFVADLARTFTPRVTELLARRRERQVRFDAGERPDFLPETADVRARDWTVAPLPNDLLDRRVEITGPTDRKMVINALNSGASVFMADFEDANSPTWDNLLQGHVNLSDAVRRKIEYTAPETGKKYALKDKAAVLLVRPRGWHLVERHPRTHDEEVGRGADNFDLARFDAKPDPFSKENDSNRE